MCSTSEQQPDAGFALVDGKCLGLQTLLEPLPPSDPAIPPLALWRLPHALMEAAPREHTPIAISRPLRYSGAAWPHAEAKDDYLCYWRADETRAVAGDVGWHGNLASADLLAALADDPMPRLATATLLRGVPARSVANFARYHRAVGFALVYLYFDAPHEEADALAAARAVGELSLIHI